MATHLNVELRSAQKKASRKLQKTGRVPAVVYGSKIKNLYLSLKENDAVKYSTSAFENKIFTLSSSNKQINGILVLKKDVDYHRLTRKPIHIDFLALAMDQKVRVTVEIRFLGKAKGVKEQGGVFNILRRNVEVECLAGQIPSHFEIDVTDLSLNQSYHISDLSLPKNIKLITRLEETLCLISKAQDEEITPSEGEEASKEESKEENTTDAVQPVQDKK